MNDHKMDRNQISLQWFKWSVSVISIWISCVYWYNNAPIHKLNIQISLVASSGIHDVHFFLLGTHQLDVPGYHSQNMLQDSNSILFESDAIVLSTQLYKHIYSWLGYTLAHNSKCLIININKYLTMKILSFHFCIL